VALVKSRAPLMKKVVVALYSFSRWVRQGKNLEALSDQIAIIITNTLQVRRAQRPGYLRARALRLIEALYGDLQNSKYLWRCCPKRNTMVKTPLLQELELLIETVDMTRGEGFVYWNYVEEGCKDNLLGKPVGSPFCETTEESAAQVVVPVLNFLTAKSWVTATESRWTNIFSVLRRFVIGLAINGVLSSALTAIRQQLDIDDSIEEALAKAVLHDRENFSAKSRLRLLRITKALTLKHISPSPSPSDTSHTFANLPISHLGNSDHFTHWQI
jgi:hypothetical protein